MRIIAISFFALFLLSAVSVTAQPICDVRVYDAVKILTGPEQIQLSTIAKTIAQKGIDARIILVKNPQGKSAQELIIQHLGPCNLRSDAQMTIVYDLTNQSYSVIAGSAVRGQTSGENLADSLLREIQSGQATEVYNNLLSGLEHAQTEVQTLNLTVDKPEVIVPAPPPQTGYAPSVYILFGSMLLIGLIGLIGLVMGSRQLWQGYLKPAFREWAERKSLQQELLEMLDGLDEQQLLLSNNFATIFQDLKNFAAEQLPAWEESEQVVAVKFSEIARIRNLGIAQELLVPRAGFRLPDQSEFSAAIESCRQISPIIDELGEELKAKSEQSSAIIRALAA